MRPSPRSKFRWYDSTQPLHLTDKWPWCWHEHQRWIRPGSDEEERPAKITCCFSSANLLEWYQVELQRNHAILVAWCCITSKIESRQILWYSSAPTMASIYVGISDERQWCDVSLVVKNLQEIEQLWEMSPWVLESLKVLEETLKTSKDAKS